MFQEAGVQGDAVARVGQHLLGEGETQHLRHSTLNLINGKLWIQDAARIVGGYVSQNSHLSGVSVHLNLGEVRSEGVDHMVAASRRYGGFDFNLPSGFCYLRK